jgi:hypothetical protein
MIDNDMLLEGYPRGGVRRVRLMRKLHPARPILHPRLGMRVGQSSIRPIHPLTNCVVGHGGHGGGGHGGRTHGRGRGGGPAWGTWGDWGDGYVIDCPDGSVVLPDGTCVDASLLNYRTGHAVLVSWDGQVPRALRHTVGVVLGPGGSNEPLPGAGATSTATSGNPTADALNLQWTALANFLSTHPKLGTNPSLSRAYAPDIASSQWLDDYQGWQTFYAQVPNWMPTWASITGDLTGWQAYANAWGGYFQSQFPNEKTFPPNFPTGQAGIQSVLPSISSLVPGLQAAASALSTAVVAVAIGVGLWFLWPVLVHVRG